MSFLTSKIIKEKKEEHNKKVGGEESPHRVQVRVSWPGADLETFCQYCGQYLYLGVGQQVYFDGQDMGEGHRWADNINQLYIRDNGQTMRKKTTAESGDDARSHARIRPHKNKKSTLGPVLNLNLMEMPSNESSP
jgi:hypothetical protein